MDEQFKKLQAPKRTLEQQTQSYKHIKSKIKLRARYQRLQVIGTGMATVALIFVLLTMLINNSTIVPNHAASSAPLEKAYYFTNLSAEPIEDIDKWYYTSKTKIAPQDLKFLAQIADNTIQATRVYEGDGLPPASRDFLLFYDDGAKQYLQYWATTINQRQEQFVMDVATKQVYELTEAESAQLQKLSRELRIVSEILKLVIFGLVVSAALLVCLKFNLLGSTEKFNRTKKWKPFLLGIGFYVYATILQGVSLYYFGAENGLFVASLLLLPILLYHWRQLGKSHYQVSTWVLPIVTLVAIYYVFVLI